MRLWGMKGILLDRCESRQIFVGRLGLPLSTVNRHGREITYEALARLVMHAAKATSPSCESSDPLAPWTRDADRMRAAGSLAQPLRRHVQVLAKDRSCLELLLQRLERRRLNDAVLQ